MLRAAIGYSGLLVVAAGCCLARAKQMLHASCHMNASTEEVGHMPQTNSGIVSYGSSCCGSAAITICCCHLLLPSATGSSSSLELHRSVQVSHMFPTCTWKSTINVQLLSDSTSGCGGCYGCECGNLYS